MYRSSDRRVSSNMVVIDETDVNRVSLIVPDKSRLWLSSRNSVASSNPLCKCSAAAKRDTKVLIWLIIWMPVRSPKLFEESENSGMVALFCTAIHELDHKVM